MNQAMTTPEQPYFTVRVTKCGECPHCITIPSQNQLHQCGLEFIDPFSRERGWPALIYLENRNGITPSCPMWPQRVQQEKKDG